MTTVQDRFWAKVDASGDCWEWTAATHDGYGRFSTSPGHQWNAHRLAYEWLIGPIPAGFQLDHLCRNRACVNPDHLEPVTAQENTRRSPNRGGQLKKTTCPQGHPYSEANTYQYPATPTRASRRGCRICIRVTGLRAYHRRQTVAI